MLPQRQIDLDNPPPQQPLTPIGGGSLSDLLTVARNLVQAYSKLAQEFLDINGALDAPALSAPTLVKPTAGRVCSVSVIVAGSANGTIYDTTSISAPVNPVYKIPNTVGLTVVNMPMAIGIVVVPGTGQTVTVSYS